LAKLRVDANLSATAAAETLDIAEDILSAIEGGTVQAPPSRASRLPAARPTVILPVNQATDEQDLRRT
jgi:hypothetical protein